MLIKLIKRDFSYTYREFAGLFLAFVLTAVFTLFAFSRYNAAPQKSDLLLGIAMLVVTAVAIAAIVISIVGQFKLFQRNIYTNEGYLTMSLPVSTEMLVLSKLITGTIWIILVFIVATVVSLISGQIMISLFFAGEDVPNLFQLFAELKWHLHLTSAMIPTALLGILVMIANMMGTILQLDFCCSVAYLPQLRRFRVPAGIILFFVLNAVVGWLYDIISDLIPDSAYNNMYYDNFTTMINDPVVLHNANTSLLIILAITVFLAAILFFATVVMVKRRFELE